MKTCTKCHIEKEESEFYKHNRLCKTCIHKKRYEYKKEWARQNKEKVQKARDNWLKKHPEYDHYQKIKEGNRKWKEKNKESVKSYRVRWYKENIGHARSYAIAWNKKHSDRVIEKNKRHTVELSNGYVKKYLRKAGFSDDQINDELIEIKRLIIKIKRHVKKTKKANERHS